VDLEAFLKEAAKRRVEKLRQQENAASGRTGTVSSRQEERKRAAVEVTEILDPVEQEPVRRISRSEEGKQSATDRSTPKI